MTNELKFARAGVAREMLRSVIGATVPAIRL
jgi:hypothetical protein